MKKLFAIALSATMVIALAACGASSGTGTSTTASSTETSTAASTEESAAVSTASTSASASKAASTAESIADSSSDFTLSVATAGTKGNEINKVAYIPMSTTSDYFLAMSDAFTAKFKEAGFESEYTSPDFDPVKQQEILENYVTQGYDCIVLFPINAASLSSAVADAQAKGVKVVCQVNKIDGCDGWVGTDGKKLGEGTAQLAADWVEKTFPDAADGSVKAAVIEVRTDDNNNQMADGCEEISTLCSKVNVVSTVQATEETEVAAQEAAENLYTTNPDVQLVICSTGTLAKGVNSYLTSMSTPVSDLSKVGVFTSGSDNEIFEMVKNSPTNSSVIRGISSYAPMSVGAQILTNILLNLSNGKTGDDNFQADPQYLLTPDNIDQYLAVS